MSSFSSLLVTLRTRSGEQLDTWLAKGADSQIPE